MTKTVEEFLSVRGKGTNIYKHLLCVRPLAVSSQLMCITDLEGVSLLIPPTPLPAPHFHPMALLPVLARETC